jgi:hypothetical protein
LDTRVDADAHLHEFVVPMVPPSWNNRFSLGTWPTGMRLIVREERPRPGAQLRITDVAGLRVTAFVTNTFEGQPADLELRHRRRARYEDRIRCAKDTGLTNLPRHDLAQNQIWGALVALTCELTAWMKTLALTGQPGHEAARRWEPKRRAAPPVLHPRPNRPHRPPPTAAPGRHRTVHRPRPGRARSALQTDRPTAQSRDRLTAGNHPDDPKDLTGPWSRRPPERHRANRRTPMRSSRQRGTRTPTTTSCDKITKDHG